jgi:hypothetical protein
MRFALKHPKRKRLKATYGWDLALGFFVEIEDDGVCTLEYDRVHPPYDELNGALRLLVAEGFLSASDVDDAVRLGGALLPHEMDPGPGRAAVVIDDFKRSAD